MCFFSDDAHRVESKIFYGHKIVLVTASPRLQSLLSSKVNEGNGTPTVQINDIRYHIFEVRCIKLTLTETKCAQPLKSNYNVKQSNMVGE
jgi:hypothetical protein